MSSESAGTVDEERPRREIAHRMFAAEFDDASLSYSESDEERAPNYVATPTGARANRLFVAGVLTELDDLDGQLRARIVDPTGAFVVYAGQYQPDALAALERLSPPAFVAVTGKARTFEPEDSDRVFTSVRPETISEIDATTRDRWITETAGRTIDRVSEFAAALAEDGAAGDTPNGASSPQSGIALAREHYGTTPAYLAAVREMALDAARLVAGDIEEVGSLDRTPNADGDADLAALASNPLGGVTVSTLIGDDEDDERTTVSAESESGPGPEPGELEPETETDRSGPTATDAAASPGVEPSGEASTDVEAEETAAAADDPLAAGSEASDETEGEAVETAGTPAAEDDGDRGGTFDDEDLGDAGIGGMNDSDGEESDGIGGVDDSNIGGSGIDDDDGTDASGDGVDAGDDIEEFDGEFDLSDAEREEIEAEYGTDFATGTEVDDPGEADIEPTAPPVDEEADEPSAEDPAASDFDADDELTTDTERVSPAANADTNTETDAPTVEADTGVGTDAEPEAELEPGTEPATPASDDDDEPPRTGEPANDDESSGGPVDEGVDVGDTETAGEPAIDGSEAEPAANDELADEGGATESEGTTAAEDADDAGVAEDIDIGEAVMDAMRDLDDGDGADRGTLVERVSEEYGVDESAVRDAIQDALLGGQCYSPGDEQLKAI